MRYRVFLHPRAKEYLDALDDAVRERMKKKAEELAKHPERGKPLKHSSFWSLRVGDHCVIYEIQRETTRIVILFMGHRKDVYDDFSKLL
ncbi:MAG: type II toxin-antitoxin system RelE family toxin [Thermoplasmatota archaeon]